jgi:hypothetical protein
VAFGRQLLNLRVYCSLKLLRNSTSLNVAYLYIHATKTATMDQVFKRSENDTEEHLLTLDKSVVMQYFHPQNSVVSTELICGSCS